MKREAQDKCLQKLNRLGLREAHNQGIDIFFDCALLKQIGKGICGFNKPCVINIRADNYS